jgi:hypothetical protein
MSLSKCTNIYSKFEHQELVYCGYRHCNQNVSSRPAPNKHPAAVRSSPSQYRASTPTILPTTLLARGGRRPDLT